MREVPVPDGGSQCRVRANMSIRISPTQKTGSEIPQSAINDAVFPMKLSLKTADMTPRIIPAMVANRVRGVRAAVYYGGSLDIIKLSRAHNDANVLALGGRFLTKEEAFEVVRLWLGTPFEGGRHSRRVQNIDPTP